MRRILVVLALCIVTGSLPASAELVPPVPLRTPMLTVPVETAGSGLAPEVDVRVHLTERGKVAAVEILRIEPSTDRDSLFREEIERTLGRWRFAPALRDGVPEATTLEWKVKFPAKAEARSAVESTAGGPIGSTPLETSQQRILALSRGMRLELQRQQIEAARRHLDPAHTRRVATGRFLVWSDAEREGTAETVANNLEAVHAVLASSLLADVEHQEGGSGVHVFVYGKRAAYERMASEMGVFRHAGAFYSPAGLIALHVEVPVSDWITVPLLHEAAHAFMDRHVVRPGVPLPTWMAEGFAEYVSNSRVKKGKLVAGKTLKAGYHLLGEQVHLLKTTAGERLDEAKRAIRSGAGISVSELLAADHEIFYGDEIGLYYASAWLFVHFLRHGEEAWDEERFPDFLLYLAEGFPATEAFESVYGMGLSQADEAFRRYVRSF